MKSVTIYSTPTCHFCHAAKEYFKEHDIKYTEKDVSQDLEARQEMVEKSGQLGVPVIEVGGDILVGFREEELAEKLGVAK